MQAVVSLNGRELQVRTVEKPLPRADELLVKVRAVSLNPADNYLYKAPALVVWLMFGARKPASGVVGADLSGTVEAVGERVSAFKQGDEVFGSIAQGAFAEYACGREDLFVRKPEAVSFEEAAAIPIAATSAFDALQKLGEIREGQRVLINGASGGVGSYAVQMAKAFGAVVTGVCSTDNVDAVKSLGADHVIDYKREDVVAGNYTYDLILDNALKRPVRDYLGILAEQGKYVVVGGDMSPAAVAQMWWISMTSSKKMSMFFGRVRRDNLEAVKKLFDKRQISASPLTHCSFEDLPKAMHQLKQGHTKGKIVSSPVAHT